MEAEEGRVALMEHGHRTVVAAAVDTDLSSQRHSQAPALAHPYAYAKMWP